MQFPIQIVFRFLTLHPQMRVLDQSGNLIGYVQKSLFALKEAVTVFTDEAKTKPIYKINADRIIDFNANYAITNAEGQNLGLVSRHGMRSLWRASYVIHGRDQGATFEVHERNPFVRIIDTVIGEIPFVGALTGLFLNPVYDITRTGGGSVLTMTKHRSILESRFGIEQQGALNPAEQETVLLGLMMIILLERSRG